MPPKPDMEVSRPVSILVIRTGHLGDTVAALPALRLIRAWAPSARLTLLCDQPMGGQTPARTVLEPMGVTDAIATYCTRPRWRAALSIWRIVRQERPALAIVLGQARATKQATARVVQALRLMGVAEVKVSNPIIAAGDLWPGEAERLCTGLRAVGIAGPTPPFAIPPFVQAQDVVQQRLLDLGIAKGARYLVFCGGGKAPAQRWPLDRYAQVLQAVVAARRLPVIAVGSTTEVARYRAAFGANVPGIHYLDGLSLPELFELFRSALAYLGNDTGPMHVAASVGCPVMAVMSARNAPGQWYPEVQPRLLFRRDVPCQNCFLQDCTVERHRCMTEITTNEVAEGAMHFLTMLTDGVAVHNAKRVVDDESH